MADADDEPVLDRSFRGHKGAVTSLAFNPTTRQLASGSADGEPRLRLSAIGGSCLAALRAAPQSAACPRSLLPGHAPPPDHQLCSTPWLPRSPTTCSAWPIAAHAL